MKKFTHEQFLEDNNIDYRILPEMLYKRIKGFEELKEDLLHTTDEDKEKLTDKLEMLSHELLEDMEEHFEENLENNDPEEEDQPEPVMEPEPPVMNEPVAEHEAKEELEQIEPVEEEVVIEQPVEEQVQEQSTNEEPAPIPEPEPETQPESEPMIEPTDEEILKEFLSAQKYLVSHSELKEKGFKTALSGKTVFVGKLCLHKGKYDTCYKIIING